MRFLLFDNYLFGYNVQNILLNFIKLSFSHFINNDSYL